MQIIKFKKIKKYLNFGEGSKQLKRQAIFWGSHFLCATLIAIPLAYFFKFLWQNTFLIYFLIILFYHVKQIQKLNLTFKQYLGYEDLDDEYQSFEDLKKANPNSALWQEIYYFLNKHDLKHHKKQEKLQKKYQNFVQAIEASPNGVMIASHQGEILWFNQMIREFLQLKKEDAGKNIYALLRQPKFHEYFKQIYQKEINEKGQETIHFNHSFAKYAAPIIALGSHFLKIEWVFIDEQRALLIFRDMTEIQTLENQRRDFLNHISHELSTPLTVILGYSEALMDDLSNNLSNNLSNVVSDNVQSNYILNTEQAALYQEFATSIHQRAHDMHLLIQDLLFMNKLEAERKKQLLVTAAGSAHTLKLNSAAHNYFLTYSNQGPIETQPQSQHDSKQETGDHLKTENFMNRLKYLIEQSQKLNLNIPIHLNNQMPNNHSIETITYPKNKNRYFDTIFNNLIQNALFYSDVDKKAPPHLDLSMGLDLQIKAPLDNANHIQVNISEILTWSNIQTMAKNKDKNDIYQASYFFNIEKIEQNLSANPHMTYHDRLNDLTFLKIDIIDQGIGIEAIHLPLLTQGFYRVDESRTHLSGGTGLGLTLVTQILEQIGGCLQIQSTPHLGSCFSVYLPLFLALAD